MREIGNDAFARTQIASISLPNSLNSIGAYAFTECSSLTKVLFGTGLKKIEEGAFSKTGLTSISFPEALTDIGNKAFEDCSQLETISLGSDIKNIGERAFGSCSKLTGDILSNIPTVAPDAFEGCADIRFVDYSLKALAKALKSSTISYRNDFVVRKAYQNGLIQTVKDGRIGWMDRYGKRSIPNSYYDLENHPYYFSEGLACVVKRYGNNYKYGYIDTEGQEVIPFNYSHAEPFVNGYAKVKKEGVELYINKKGKEFNDLPTEKEVAKEMTWQKDSLTDNGKPRWYLVGKNGNVMLDSIYYDQVMDFNEDRARVKKDNKWGFIDKSGNEIVAPTYAQAEDFSCGMACVTDAKTKKYGFVDAGGNLAVPCNYTTYTGDTKKFSDDMFRIRKNNKYGFINKLGEEVIAPSFDNAEEFSDGTAKVQKGGKWGLVDKTGKLCVPCNYSEVQKFVEGLALVSNDLTIEETDSTAGGTRTVFGFVDKDGHEVVPCAYDAAESFKGGYAKVKKGDKWGAVDTNGKEALPFTYDELITDCDGLFLLKQGEKWGIADTKGHSTFDYDK